MYYKFSNNYISRKSVHVPLSTFQGIDEESIESNLPIKYSSDILGFSAEDNRLKINFGARLMKSEEGVPYGECQFKIDNIYPFYLNGTRQLIASSDTRAFKLNSDTNEWEIVPLTFFSGEDSVMFTVGEDPSIIIPKLDGGLISYNGYVFKDMQLPYSPVAMCTHMNRLFLVDKGDEYRLRFSSVNDPFDFHISLDEGGEIYLDVEDGKILKMISYNGNLYIFREYGIYRLTAYGDQRDFVMKKILCTSSKIIGKSIALAGSVMVFVASDGMYSFDGYNMRRITDNIKESVESINVHSTISAIYYNGKYYLAYSTDNLDINRYVLIYDLEKHSLTKIKNSHVFKFFMVRNMDDREELGMVLDNIKRIAVLDASGKCIDVDIPKIWRSPKVDFGIVNKTKTIVGFCVDKDERYSMTIMSDSGENRRYHIDGKADYYRVGLSGKHFYFLIEGKDREVHSPIIEVKLGE